MAGPIEESLELFVNAVFSNQNLDEATKKQIILSGMNLLADKITDATHRWGMSISLGKLAQDVGQRKS